MMDSAPSPQRPSLLAVDLGLRCGLALYGNDGRLRWYRSHNLGARSRMRRAAEDIIGGCEGLAQLVVEGDRDLGAVWRKSAARRGIAHFDVTPEAWRAVLLAPRERRDAATAKRSAGQLARRVIDWSGARKPTSLRHDAAEAILIGLYGVMQVGWLSALPAQLRPTGTRGRR